jgi:hypothetical protein
VSTCHKLIGILLGYVHGITKKFIGCHLGLVRVLSDGIQPWFFIAKEGII